MSHVNQLHGNHTWDLILHYEACPSCQWIIENKDKFTKNFEGVWKDLECSRCLHRFRVQKKNKPSFGPLLGYDSEILD